MFKGGQKRLLPPIKNPLFNPNEDNGNEVRIAAVKSGPEKTKGGRLSNLFGSRHRNSSRGSYGVENEDEKASLSGSDRPSSSDLTTASSLNTANANKKDLPKLGKADQQASSTSARSLLSSRTKFSRNLTPSCNSSNVNNSEDETNGNMDAPVSTSSDGRHSGLLKRGKERPPSLLNKDDVESSRSFQVPDKLRAPSSVPSECDITRKVRNSITPTPDETTKPPKYQDALSLRNDWRAAKASGDYKSIQGFLTCTFDSFNDINAVFKKKDDCLSKEDHDGSFIDYDFVRITYDIVLTLPQEVQKAVLKSIINGLLLDMKR
ncbi:putative E3 ubiquitin-protein ligase HECTD2 [Exaiptasia diaphana]|nr:putative E3 ubiquitin-protein ligase HECTD2 [Exaiptasia diaphana]